VTPGEARIVLQEARRWADEGLIGRDVLSSLEARYGDTAAGASPAGFGAVVLFGVGGTLLGGAGIAAVELLGFSSTWKAYLFALFAAAFAALGLTAASRRIHSEGLSDALLVAAIIHGLAASVTSLDREARIPALACAALPAVLFWKRRHRRLVPAASSIAFFPAVAGGIQAVFSNFPWISSMLYGAATVSFLAMTLALGKRLAAPWRMEVLGIAALGAASAALVVSQNMLHLSSSRSHELFLGAVMTGVLALGLTTREKGLSVAAGAVLVVDVVTYAFDVGGLFTGVVLLILLALIALAKAESVRRAGASARA
jgi:hypothetical protein